MKIISIAAAHNPETGRFNIFGLDEAGQLYELDQKPPQAGGKVTKLHAATYYWKKHKVEPLKEHIE